MAKVSKKVFVDLFYDVISPYSWFAFEGLSRFNKKSSSMDLRLRPIFIGALMQETGNKPPATVPAKALYMNEDLNRLGEYYQLPFNIPKDIFDVMFKKGSLVTQRLLTAVQQDCPEYLEDLSREFFMRIWSKNQDVISVESLIDACQNAGISKELIDSLIAKTQDAGIKQSLKDTTQLALDHGAFGAPTYVAHLPEGPKMFFGADRIFLLAHYLKEPFPGTLTDFNSCKL